MVTSVGDLPELRNTRCVRYRFRYSQCSICADVCPADALAPTDEGVELNAVNCSGCGLCVTACPTSVYNQPSFPIPSLIKPVKQDLVVACNPSGQEGEVRVPCLGDIDPVLLASLAMRNVAVTLRGAGHCNECAYSPQGEMRVEMLLAGMRELEEAGPDKWTAPVAINTQSNYSHRADRRQLFRRFGNRAVENIREEMEYEEVPESAIRIAAHYIPARRQLAERILERLDSIGDESILPALFGVADIEARAGHCTGCEACARVCPTGAIKLTEINDSWTLYFNSGQCVGCNVCIEACGADALRIHAHWNSDTGTPAILHQLGRYRCESCGRFFIGLEVDACPVCKDDEDNFDAIFG